MSMESQTQLPSRNVRLFISEVKVSFEPLFFSFLDKVLDLYERKKSPLRRTLLRSLKFLIFILLHTNNIKDKKERLVCILKF